ncbi:MAG: hypothetical protein IPP15_15990 [Saprospiraceae bacterium]|uniref:Virulence-associated protein E-like domain-containing protein n=1 Tax=Candidatus Opimibacter skivensis TaxID=2982028 RepID=A0A9D7SXL3_9BACT|nr:hypothetical protein [Candidatus Opimibacter skivensis]
MRKPPPPPDEPTDDETKPKKRKRADEDSETDLEKVIDYLNAEYMFQHNRITEERVFRKKQFALGEKNEWALLEEEDLNTILIEMKLNRYKVSKEVLTMIIFSRLTKSVSPIADYLSGLLTRKPTGKAAFAALCKTIKLTNETEYRKPFERLLWRWLCANAACALGQKINDVCLVFIGGQGTGKTTWLNKLCPLNDYGYCGHIDPNTTNNETANLLGEKWLINIDDQLETIFGKDFNSLKSVISAPNVSNRKAYARQAKKRARIASFVASVNSTNFLTDTQNRRYLCFEIETVNRELSNAINYDDVWAEVVQALIAGERFVFNKDEMAQLNEMNDQFLEVTQEHEWLSLCYVPATDADANVSTLTMSEILTRLTVVSGNKTLRQSKLLRALERQGFVMRQCRRPGTANVIKGYRLKDIREQSQYTHEEPEPAPF